METEAKKMHFLNKLCFICMKKTDLKHMFDVDNDGVSHYYKLTSSIAEMDFKEMNDKRLICGECCVTLNTVYTFRQMCLRSKTNLITYISRLQTSSHVSGTLIDCLTDIKDEIIIVKKEIEIKCENEDYSSSFEESNPQINFKIESNEESIHSSIKKECESDEDISAHAADHVDEEAHSDVKVEDVEHQTMMEDEYHVQFSVIDVEEDPLAVVKEEPRSDSETPQDGSTSQADAETSGSNGREGTSIGSESNTQKNMGKLYKCDKCEKTFKYKGYFTDHKKIHSGERPHECKICKKSYICKSHLANHLKIHSGEKPNKCEICKKSFLFKNTLNLHMKIHSGERPYECEICMKGFNQKGLLSSHMMLHSGERPYECEVCQKTFIHKSSLNSHFKTHAGDRPYQCEICKASFVFKGALSNHMEIHSSRRLYECEICQKSFIAKRSLTRHMKNHSENTII